MRGHFPGRKFGDDCFIVSSYFGDERSGDERRLGDRHEGECRTFTREGCGVGRLGGELLVGRLGDAMLVGRLVDAMLGAFGSTHCTDGKRRELRTLKANTLYEYIKSISIFFSFF